jgi:hypothetical protein
VSSTIQRATNDSFPPPAVRAGPRSTRADDRDDGHRFRRRMWFDSGDPASSGMQIASALAGALAYPILPLITPLSLTMRPSGFLGEHLVFVANGVVWAAGFPR